jgi:hypothetical protein
LSFHDSQRVRQQNTGFCLRNTGFAFVKLAPSPDHFQRKLYLPCRTAADLEMQKINAAIQNPQSCMPLAAFVTHHFPHGEKKLRPSTTYGCKRLWDDHKSFCLADGTCSVSHAVSHNWPVNRSV